MELCLWTGLSKKICILEIIYQVHDMKGASHPFFPPQWEHIQIVYVCLYYIKWNFLSSQRQSSANRLVLPFNNSIKNGHSCYEYQAIKHKQTFWRCFSFYTADNSEHAKKWNNLRIWLISLDFVKLSFPITEICWLLSWLYN